MSDTTSKPADGGPAFPSTLQYFPEDTNYINEQGLSLRDYFAAKAMGAFCEGAEGLGAVPDEKVLEAFDAVARFAYIAADAMLKARG
ncbi:hypothetical protein [Burkholderia plantarii]|uniref:hypothetical protein n=1 Tax=Burkholderia plantarii TaxID=41899 RepID=UPI0008706D65|nr:hypothetical protein [Burkholderia plantarii]